MTSTSPKTRRRDQELESAIIAAAWKELQRKGYAALTMESVATQAATSRSVLARRWGSKAALVVATVRDQLEQHPYTLPNHGSLRPELIDYLAHVSSLAPLISIIFSLLSNSKFREIYPSPALLRNALVSDQNDNLKLILQHAVAREEIHATKLTPPIQSLLSDLIGHYILIHNEAPSAALCHAWVDDIFLPLVLKASSPALQPA